MPHDVERVRPVDLSRAECRAIVKRHGPAVRWLWRCRQCGRLWPYEIVLDRNGCPKQREALDESQSQGEVDALVDFASAVHDDEHAGPFETCDLHPCAAAHELALAELRESIAAHVDFGEG